MANKNVVKPSIAEGATSFEFKLTWLPEYRIRMAIFNRAVGSKT